MGILSPLTHDKNTKRHYNPMGGGGCREKASVTPACPERCRAQKCSRRSFSAENSQADSLPASYRIAYGRRQHLPQEESSLHYFKAAHPDREYAFLYSGHLMLYSEGLTLLGSIYLIARITWNPFVNTERIVWTHPASRKNNHRKSKHLGPGQQQQ